MCAERMIIDPLLSFHKEMGLENKNTNPTHQGPLAGTISSPRVEVGGEFAGHGIDNRHSTGELQQANLS